MKKTLRNILIVVLLLIIGLIVLVGYWGFVPGLSALMGSNKPRDLGVTFDEKTYLEGQEKAGIEFVVQSTPDSISSNITFEGKHSLVDSFTSSEISAIASHRNFGSYPIRNVQIKINADGSAEMSGTLDIEKGIVFAKKLGATEEDIQKGMDFAKLPFKDMPFYIKTSGVGVSNNKISGSITSLEVGRFPIPGNVISTYSPALNTAITRAIVQDQKYVRKLELKDGKAFIDADYPNKVIVK